MHLLHTILAEVLPCFPRSLSEEELKCTLGRLGRLDRRFGLKDTIGKLSIKG